MENLSLIAAIGKNGELGLNNHLPWHIPEDLSFYKKMTMGKNLIVGKNTFFSMPQKAFIGRYPIILSHEDLDTSLNVVSFASVKSILEYINIYKEDEFMVIGGATIYNQFLPYVNTMYLTEIDESFNADVYFPKFCLDEWNKEEMGIYLSNDEKIIYSRNKYVRKRVK